MLGLWLVMPFFLSKTTSLGYVGVRLVVSSFTRDHLLGYVKFKSCGVVYLEETISLGYVSFKSCDVFFL